MTSRRNPLLRTAYGISPDRNLRDRQVSILHSSAQSQDNLKIPFLFLSTEKDFSVCIFGVFILYFMTTNAGTYHNWLLLSTRHVSFEKQNSILSIRLVWGNNYFHLSQKLKHIFFLLTLTFCSRFSSTNGGWRWNPDVVTVYFYLELDSSLYQ